MPEALKKYKMETVLDIPANKLGQCVNDLVKSTGNSIIDEYYNICLLIHK